VGKMPARLAEFWRNNLRLRHGHPRFIANRHVQ
jgi:hypothetical protein